MSRLFMSGAETQDSVIEGWASNAGATGSPPMQSVASATLRGVAITPRAGSLASARFWKTNGNFGGGTVLAPFYTTGSNGVPAGQWGYLSLWVYLLLDNFAIIVRSSSVYEWRMAFTNDTVNNILSMRIFGDFGVAAYVSPTNFYNAGWTKIDLGSRFNNDSTIDVQAQINQIPIFSGSMLQQSAISGNTDLFAGFQIVVPQDNIAFDDVVFQDDQGSANKGFAFDEHVGLSLPTSDNTVGASWVNGAGGATNLWDGVNNTPPVGVVNASATAGSQIKGTGNNLASYSASLQSQATLGVPSNANLKAWQVMAAVGTSGGGNVDATISSTSPAAMTSATVSPGATAVGTYPTGWTVVRTPPKDAPTLAAATQPVHVVARATANANTLQDCALFGLFSFEVPPTGNVLHLAIPKIGLSVSEKVPNIQSYTPHIVSPVMAAAIAFKANTLNHRPLSPKLGASVAQRVPAVKTHAILGVKAQIGVALKAIARGIIHAIPPKENVALTTRAPIGNHHAATSPLGVGTRLATPKNVWADRHLAVPPAGITVSLPPATPTVPTVTISMDISIDPLIQIGDVKIEKLISFDVGVDRA